jgi:hypothetical protein
MGTGSSTSRRQRSSAGSDAGVRHWTVRVQHGGGRRNLEVLEGDGGIWRVRPVGEDLVELVPATTATVIRELVALLRREDRPTAP